MDFLPVEASLKSIEQYCKLFKLCFPSASHLSDEVKATKYLQWLYRDNPEGMVVGIDAWDGDVLAAHYSTIPVRWSFHGTIYKGLLSLNTATHPDYRGQGLFTKLANKTYSTAIDQNFEFVIGVANANSTPGFVRKLEFTLISSLNACIGFGSMPDRTRNYLNNSIELIQRSWSDESLAWRRCNPNNTAKLIGQNKKFHQIEADTDKKFIKAYAEVFLNERSSVLQNRRINPRLILGLLPKDLSWGHYISIPDIMKPSPLNLIFRSLRNRDLVINTDQLYFNFLDFDAY